MKNQAFTLIEILVVVLIIGILAAVALPQYQIAVDRADFRKYQAMAHSLEAAYDDYYMANGEAPTKFTDLTISLPQDFTPSYTSSIINCMSNNEMFCCMSNSGGSWTALVNCGKYDLSVIYAQYFFGRDYTEITRAGQCLAKVGDSRSNRLCGVLGTDIGKGNMWTPAGYENSYQVYTLN